MKKLRCNLNFMDSLLFIVGWTILSVITCGLAAPFFIFSLIKLVINSSTVDDNGVRRNLECNMNLGSDFMFILKWTLLSIITFGIATPFFMFSLIKYAINKTEIV